MEAYERARKAGVERSKKNAEDERVREEEEERPGASMKP